MTPHELRREARALIAEVATARAAATTWLPWDARGLNARIAALCCEATGLARGEASDLIAALGDLKSALDDLAGAARIQAAQ